MDRLKLFLDKKKASLSQNGIQWMGIKRVKEEGQFHQVRNEKPESSNLSSDDGYRLELLVAQKSGGQIGYVGSQDFSAEGLEESFQKALTLTKKCERFSPTELEKFFRKPGRGLYKTPVQVPLNRPPELTLAILADVTAAMQASAEVKARSGFVNWLQCEMTQLDSEGADIHQQMSWVDISLSATAQNDKDSQTRTYNLSQQIGSEAWARHRLLPVAKEIGQQAVELLSAENCPTGEFDLVLAPDQMALQIHESVGHPLELDRIIGDERNFAGWSFVKPEDFGQLQYGSELMNINFDPQVGNELASYDYDDLGLKAEKVPLIQKGRLLNPLGSLESVERWKKNRMGTAEIRPVANFRSSSWNRAPIDRMANLNLAPGSDSVQDLISRVENGFMFTTNRSWSIDDYRRKFQFGCEYARKIEKGVLGRVFKNPNYRGISVPFWNKLAGLSHESDLYGTFYCGKGEPNQIIKVGHKAPFCLFKNVEVFGGG